MRPQRMIETIGSNPNVKIYICPHENFRIPRPIGNEVIKFRIKLLLFLKIIRVIHRSQEDFDNTLRSPVVRVGRYVRPIGKAKSNPNHPSRELGRGGGGDRLQLACAFPGLCECRVQNNHDCGTRPALTVRSLHHTMVKY